MSDDPIYGPTKAYLEALQSTVGKTASLDLLPKRLLAVAGLEIFRRVPEVIRTHIYTTLTFVVAQHPEIAPEEAAPIMSLLRGLLLPEKTDGWATSLQGDSLVQAALKAGERNYMRTVHSFEMNAKKKEQEKKE